LKPPNGEDSSPIILKSFRGAVSEIAVAAIDIARSDVKVASNNDDDNGKHDISIY